MVRRAGRVVAIRFDTHLTQTMWLCIIWSLKVAQAISLGVVQVLRTNAITLGSIYHRHHAQSTINTIGIVCSVIGNFVYASGERAPVGWVVVGGSHSSQWSTSGLPC